MMTVTVPYIHMWSRRHHSIHHAVRGKGQARRGGGDVFRTDLSPDRPHFILDVMLYCKAHMNLFFFSQQLECPGLVVNGQRPTTCVLVLSFRSFRFVFRLTCVPAKGCTMQKKICKYALPLYCDAIYLIASLPMYREPGIRYPAPSEHSRSNSFFFFFFFQLNTEQ
jgi:hypothetical protein